MGGVTLSTYESTSLTWFSPLFGGAGRVGIAIGIAIAIGRGHE